MSTGKLRKANSLNINDTRIAGLYDLEHTIGKGHFAVVKLARHVFTGEKVAVKVIDKTRLDPVSTTHMMQEVRCMKLVQHPNIIRLYEIIDTQTKLFLILELGDYDMYDYIMKHDVDKAGGFKEQDAQQYFNQIIKAIDYCHTLHVVHRDLKPENVIFFEKLGMVKLTDFGFSNLFTPGERLETSCGSLAYSAPEILLGDAYDAPAVDVWSLGVILYMLVCGRLPFQEANESETLTKILDCKFVVPDYVSTPCKQLISRMLVRDPIKRATLDEIIQSAWVLAGDRGHAEALPLIERDHLPESAHTTIIEQMVAGGIGSEEEIVGAIEDDMYNYITTTYYLLAERVLAAYRQEQASRLLSRVALPSVVHSTYASIEETNESGDGASTSNSTSGGGNGSNVLSARSRSNSWRGSTNARRACSILKEESEEELSSYLRSSSRQSSRFYNRGSGRAPSRTKSLDIFMPEIHQIILESLEGEDLCETLDDDKSSDFPTDPADYLTLLAGRLDAVGRGGDFRIPPRDASTFSALRSPSLLSASCGSSNAILFPPLRHSTRGPLRRSDSSVEGTYPHPLNRLARSVDLGMMKPADLTTSASPSIQIAKGGHDGTFPFDFSTTAPSTPCSWNNELRSLLAGTALQDYNEQKYVDGSETPGKYYSSSTGGDPKRRSASSYFYPATRTFFNIPANMLAKNNKRRRALSAMSRRNSSPSVSMFGGVSVQSSTGICSSREQVSPQAIQELLEFSRLNGKRAASPDSRISSRSSSPPCSSGRASPAVNAIMSRLKAANLIPSIGGMRKLSSSPHLLGICEESEDGFFDNPNAHPSAVSSAGTISHNRSFISGSSASLKRRGNRSASIGFVNARSSQRFSDVGSGGSDAVKNGIRGSTPRCIFSTSFEHQIPTLRPSTSSSQFFTPDRESAEEQALGDLSPPKSFSIHLSSMDNSPRTGRLKHEVSTSSGSSTHSLHGGGFTTTTIIDELSNDLTAHAKLRRLRKPPAKKEDAVWDGTSGSAYEANDGLADKPKLPSMNSATSRP